MTILNSKMETRLITQLWPQIGLYDVLDFNKLTVNLQST